jgi:hypothetical protein
VCGCHRIPSGNIIEYNNCTGQKNPESGGFESRGNGNIFRYNEVYGNLGFGVRLGSDTTADGIGEQNPNAPFTYAYAYIDGEPNAPAEVRHETRRQGDKEINTSRVSLSPYSAGCTLTASVATRPSEQISATPPPLSGRSASVTSKQSWSSIQP